MRWKNAINVWREIRTRIVAKEIAENMSFVKVANHQQEGIAVQMNLVRDSNLKDTLTMK